MRSRYTRALLSLTAVAALAAPMAAQAHRSDDPPNHVRHEHRVGDRRGHDDVVRRGSDDGVRHSLRGSDDGVRHSLRGSDDGVHHDRHGSDDGPNHR
jgi:Ni/Co efflux regulator RcnB